MNVTTKEVKATKKIADRLALLFLPEKKLSQIVLWMLIPTILLLFSVTLSFINRSPITLYIPVVAITTLCLSIYYRTIGFYISFVGLLFFALFFYRAIPFDQRLWQMEILFSFAIDSFIILLAIEEVEVLLCQLETKSQKDQERVHSISHDQKEAEKKWEEEKEAFEAEIERWKTEAEQRRIDKQNDEKRFELMRSDIEMLSSQKEGLIADAFEARSLASERLRRLEEQIEETERQAVDTVARTSDPELIREKARVEGLYKQLCSQFEEKAKALAQARKELFQAQGQVSVHEIEAAENEIQGDFTGIESLRRDLDWAEQEKAIMEEEITLLESLVSRFLSL